MAISKLNGTPMYNIDFLNGVNLYDLDGLYTQFLQTVQFDTTGTGTAETFSTSGSLNRMHVTLMDSTHAIAVYLTGSGVTAVCLTISGTTVTAGTPTSISGSAAQWVDISVCTMDSTHAIVCYTDTGNSSYGTACCLTLSGTTITANTEVVFESASTSYMSVCSLSSTTAIASYRNSAFKGAACFLSLSGTTITAETPVLYKDASVSENRIAAMDSTHAIVLYEATGDRFAVCLSTSGTTITVNTERTVSTVNSGGGEVALCKVSSTKVLFVWQSDSFSNSLSAATYTLSGTTLTISTSNTSAAEISSSYDFDKMEVAMVGTNTALVVLYYTDSNRYGNTVTLFNVDTGSISGSPFHVFNAVTTKEVACCGVDSSNVLIVSQDNTTGAARVATVGYNYS